MAHARTWPAVIVATLAWSTLACAQPTFDQIEIDTESYGDCKAIGDVDGDGLPDLALAGLARLSWYQAPNWTRRDIAVPMQEFTDEMQFADVDGDGDLDLVVPDGQAGRLVWYQNPRPEADPAIAAWPMHVIGNAGDWIHDVEVADVDGNGRIDVVTRGGGRNYLWLQTGSNAWTRVDLAGDGGTGLALVDVDNDGRIDIVLGTTWYRAPSNRIGGTWTGKVFATGWSDQVAVRAADLNNDGRPDLMVANSHDTGRLAWYEGPVSPATQSWPERVVTYSLDYVHSFTIADIDGDSNKDIVFAEMAQSSRKRVGYFAGSVSGSWTLRTLSTSGSHNIRVADIGADGDLDILGANWQGPPLAIWVNRLDPRRCPGDWNGDRATDPADIAAFVQTWIAEINQGGVQSDTDSDGEVTPADIAVFIQTWLQDVQQGC